jgi:serine/threonine protein kinase
MGKRLLVISGPDKGRIFPLDDTIPLLVGRSRNTETRLSDTRVSRVHCEVMVRGGKVLIADFDSDNGTFVNGQRISRHSLIPGDIITVGETQLCLQGDEASPQAESAPSRDTDAKPVKVVCLPDERLHELTGKTLSHYKVGALLAKAQTGLVFQARDLKNERMVAFKVLWQQCSKNGEQRRRFIRAMRVMLPLRHPNLVAVYGAGKTGPHCWTAMEYIAGESIQEVIHQVGRPGLLDWQHAYRVALHVGRALAFAHEHQLIHRNVRPQNILVQTSDNLIKLGDLMLAKALEGAEGAPITQGSRVLGDIRYTAPEQLSSNRVADERSDIYSLGATVYALLTGGPPIEGSSLKEMVQRISYAEPIRPKHYQPLIPDQFEEIVLKMLAKRPQDRFQTAAQLIAALKRVASDQEVKA